MNAKSFSLSVQGASHIKKNKECQDHSGCYSDENYVVAIVCDGHGGDDYMRSAKGSYYACDAAETEIRSFLEEIDSERFFSDPERYMRDLEASIINKWNCAIDEDYESHPFTEEELSGVSERARRKYLQDKRIESAYGTTLIAVAMNKEFWFGIHIGDGKCVKVSRNGEFSEPIPWDPKCFLNATTSICDSDAIEHFRHFYSKELPAAVFVGSDGIDDCFKNAEQFHNFYRTVLYSLGTSDFDSSVAELKEYLPRLSEKGSRDDMSIAAILDMDVIPELGIVKDFDKEKEKARIAENARIEAEKMEQERLRMEEEQERYREEQRRIAEREKQRRQAAEQRRLVEERERRGLQSWVERVYRGIPARKAKSCPNCGMKVYEGMNHCAYCDAPISWLFGNPEERVINAEPVREEILIRTEEEKVTGSVESVKAEETAKVEDSVKAEETARAENSAKAEEITKAEETTKAEDSVKAEETARAEKNVEAENSIKVEETAKAEEIAKVEDSVKVGETAKAEDTASVQNEEIKDNNIEEANHIEVKDDLQNSDI